MRLNCDWLNDFDDPRMSARMDSLGIFSQTELTQIIPETYDKLYPDYDAREHIPIKTNLNYALPAWAYDSFEKRGQADFLGANGNDLPRSDVAKARFTFPIRTIVTAYGWTVEEIEAARAMNMPLDREKADSAREGIAWKEHDLLVSGNANHNIPGFLTNAAVPVMAAPTGTWSGASADAMIDDLHAAVDKLFVVSQRKHRANAILLPVAQFRRFATKRVTDTGISAMKYFLDQNPEIKSIGTMLELSTAGASSTARAVVYQKDPRNLAGIVPLAFQQMEPQQKNMEMVVPCRAREGGTVWFYPMSGIFMDGI